MENFISYDKLSKKEQKRLNNIKRKGWGDINPITKVIPDKKKYNRKVKHRTKYEEDI